MKMYNAIIFFFLSLGFTHQLNSTITIGLFSHGLADTAKQAHWYAQSYKKNDGTIDHNKYYCLPPRWSTFNYPDATEGIIRVNYHETSFGQENEIECLHNAYNKMISSASKKHDSFDIVLFGLSRGASNIGIFMGLYECKDVKAIVMESPFFMMSDVISNAMTRKGLDWLPLSYGEALAEFIFKKYRRNGMSPAEVIDKIPTDMPILIVCSKEDTLVPYSSSLSIYKKLIDSGHKHAYILILDHGRHAKIITGSDRKKYQRVVHAFYKKYNLAHDSSIAAFGEKLLLECQPTL